MAFIAPSKNFCYPNRVKIRVSGIYNPQMIQYLKQFGINQFTFDFRPTSFNFTQGYRVKEILEATCVSKDTFYLHFADEKEFMITEVLKDINSLGRTEVNTCLEFSGRSSLISYETFKTPYIWHFNELVSIDLLADLKYLKAISFDQIYLERLLQFGELFNFLTKIEACLRDDQYLEINLDWGNLPMETAVDFFRFKSINFEINNSVEVSYRNPNLNLVANHIEYTKRSLNL